MSRNDSAADESRPAGERDPYWRHTAEGPRYDALDGGHRTDVLVVGAGIAGLTTALELARAGRDVAVVERDRVGEGVTARSTAKVTSQHGLRYADLASTYDEETARAYGAANEAAIDYVEERAAEFDYDVQFRRLPAYTYTEDDDRERVRNEVEMARRLSLPASHDDDVAVADDTTEAVRFDDQAQFNPRTYLLGLGTAFVDAGGQIFEGTRATDLDVGSPSRIKTNRGSVAADDVVVASHFPVFDRGGYFARLTPKHSYMLAIRTPDPPADGIYYRTGESYFSVRVCDDENEDGTLVLVGGESHKTGHGGSTAARYRRLERAARDHFDVAGIEYSWSTQDYVPVDDLPYVGKMGPLSEGVYVATGFEGWGMSNGTAAGRLLADEILGEPNPYAETFEPSRFSMSATRDVVEHNVSAAKSFVGDWATKPRAREVQNLGRGEATVLREGGAVRGVYRDEGGELHTVSAVCPHMGCLVEWSDGDRTWDCPCHGSRFNYDGRVIDGPAIDDISTSGR